VQNKGDDSDFKLSPNAKHFKVIVEAASASEAQTKALDQVTNLLGPDIKVKIKYMKNETKQN
jgi:cellobiose-specific phosphotransferase system component IIB